MELYLVQHGQAEREEIDPARPLTAQGRHETQQVAEAARRLNLQIDQIRHSGKTRAEQTAAILGQALAPAGGVVAVPGLAPKDDVRVLAGKLDAEPRPIMIVGHLPFLSRLAGLLLAGDADHPVIRFRYSAIICLAREDDHWLVAWILTPEMVRGT
jgi:phosphohistidine phosphatase